MQVPKTPHAGGHGGGISLVHYTVNWSSRQMCLGKPADARAWGRLPPPPPPPPEIAMDLALPDTDHRQRQPMLLQRLAALSRPGAVRPRATAAEWPACCRRSSSGRPGTRSRRCSRRWLPRRSECPRSSTAPSRRRDFCQFDDTPCSSLLEHLIKAQGGAAELQPRRRLMQCPDEDQEEAAPDPPLEEAEVVVDGGAAEAQRAGSARCLHAACAHI